MARPNEAEMKNFVDRLNVQYQMEGYPTRAPRPAYVDQVGEVVWTEEYLRLMNSGVSHDEACERINAQTRAIWHQDMIRDGVIPADPAPEDPPARAGIVRLERRGFLDDDGPFNAAVFTDMSALRLFEQDRTRFDLNGRGMRARHADAARILGMVGWPGREINPRRLDYLELLRECIKARYAMGLRTELTMFADCNVLGMAMPERRAHAQQTARGLKDLAHMLLFIEGSNEPGVSNYNGPWTLAQLVEIGRIVKAELPNVLYACGAPYTPPDGGTTWDDASYIALGRGGDLVTPHFDRDVAKHDAQYRPIRQAIEGQNYGFPFSNNEPIGVRSSVASDDEPGRLRAAATFTWIARGAGYCYHTDAGIGARSDQLIPAQPGADVVFDGKRILPPDAAQFQFSNWHWADNVWETVDGSLSDHDLNGRGTMRTIAGVHPDGRVQACALLVTAGAKLRARRAMELDVWRGQSGPYELIDHIRVSAGQSYELARCVDTVFVGRLL